MWTMMALLALWHVLQVRRPMSALLCTGGSEYIESNDDKNEFKTGKHTYARWSAAGDKSKVADEDLVEVAEVIEEDFMPIADEEGDEKGDEESDVDDDDDNDDDEGNTGNPLFDALKKVYSAVFFYGLEEPEPNPLYRSKVNRMNQSNRRKAMPSSRKLKSPFFTKGEQKAYFLLLDDKEYPIEGDGKGKSTPSSMSEETMYGQDDDNALVQEYPQENNELEELDRQLRNYSEKLKSLDRKIKEIQPRTPSDEKRVSILLSQRDQVLSLIEDVQIRYVTIKSLRSD